MTDIASDLADQIMALINSKPRSPTKDELVAVLAPVIAPPPAYMVTCELAAQLPKLDCEPGSWVAVSSEMMHRDLLPIPLDQKAGIIESFEDRYGTAHGLFAHTNVAPYCTGTFVVGAGEPVTKPAEFPMVQEPVDVWCDVALDRVALMSHLHEVINAGMSSNYPGLLSAKKPDGSKP